MNDSKTVKVTDAMGDVFVITMYDDHALCLTVSADKSRNGPVVKLGPEALRQLAELLQQRQRPIIPMRKVP